MKEIKSAIMAGSVTTKIGGALIKKPLSVLKDLMSTDGAGGAAFVGLKAPVVKAHGNSSELAIASALKQIHKMLESDVSGKLVEHFEKWTNKNSRNRVFLLTELSCQYFFIYHLYFVPK